MVKKDAEQKSEQDKLDLNIEISGLEVGRIKRFISSDAIQYLADQKNGKSRNKLTLLDILLLTDPVYYQLFTKLIDRIDEIESLLQADIILLNKKLSNLKIQMSEIQNNANLTNDGRRIYLDDHDGSVYTENGTKLSKSDARNIVWDKNHSRWNAYKAKSTAIEETQKYISQNNIYSDDVLGNIKQNMKSHSQPMDKEDLSTALEELEYKLPERIKLQTRNSKDNEEEYSKLNSSFRNASSDKEKQDTKITEEDNKPTNQAKLDIIKF